MIAIPGVPGNKETSKEIKNRKICTRRGSREQVAEVAGARHKSLVPATSASCARNQSYARKCPARHRIWRPGVREASGENSSLPHYVRYTSLLPLLKSPTVSHTAARALPKETGISVRLGRQRRPSSERCLEGVALTEPDGNRNSGSLKPL